MDSRERVALRIQETSEKDMLAGFFFVAELAYVSGLSGDDKAQALVRDVMGDQEVSPHIRYPVAWFLEIASRASLFPGAPEDFDAFMRGLGTTVLQRASRSPMAKAMTALSKGDPHAYLHGTTVARETIIGFGERTYEKTGERSCMMHYRDEFLGPSCLSGMLRVAAEVVTHVQLSMVATVENKSASSYSLACSW